MVTAKYGPQFVRDVKRLAKRHVNRAPLEDVIDLILEDTPGSKQNLICRHRMHEL